MGYSQDYFLHQSLNCNPTPNDTCKLTKGLFHLPLKTFFFALSIFRLVKRHRQQQDLYC